MGGGSESEMKTFLFVIACVGMVAGWSKQRTAAAELRKQVAAQLDDGIEVESLRREHVGMLRRLEWPGGGQVACFPMDAVRHGNTTLTHAK